MGCIESILVAERGVHSVAICFEIFELPPTVRLPFEQIDHPTAPDLDLEIPGFWHFRTKNRSHAS
jgi:hypothetical protein